MTLTFTEGLAGLIASILAILTGIFVAARWLGNRFDKWAETVIENSKAIRTLTFRVARLETAINGKLPEKPSK